MPNVHELVRDHVTLSIRCLDRLSLPAYLPKRQTSGGLRYFLRDHLGHPIPSPALFAPMLDRFVGAIKTYATTHDVSLISFERRVLRRAARAPHRNHDQQPDGIATETRGNTRGLRRELGGGGGLARRRCLLAGASSEAPRRAVVKSTGGYTGAVRFFASIAPALNAPREI